jgi:hypothetical protein
MALDNAMASIDRVWTALVQPTCAQPEPQQAMSGLLFAEQHKLMTSMEVHQSGQPIE